MKYNNAISTFALATALSVGLTLGGCGKKEEVITKASEKAVTKTVAKAAGKIVDIKKRKVSDAQAEQALTALSLNESGAGVLKWADRSGSAGNYTYNDVTIKGDDEDVVTIKSMELVGVHMEGEDASFDKVIFNGLHVEEDDGDHVNVTIKTLSLSEPSPALSNAIAASFGGDEDAFDDISGDVRFSGFSLAGLDLKADDGNFNIDAMEFGKAKDKSGVFTLSNFDFDVQDDEKIKMHIGAVTATGLNLEKYEGLISEAMKENPEEAMQNMMTALNPYDPDFESVSIKDVSFNVEGLVGTLESYTGNVVKKGSRIIMNQSMSPFTLKPPAEPTGDMKDFADALSTMGYSELSLTMQGTSELDEATDTMKTYDTFIELKDGFKLTYDLDMTGYKSMLEKMKASGDNAPKGPMAAMSYMSGMKIGKARVAFRDDSIIDRSFKLAANKQGGSPDALRGMAKMGIAMMPMQAKDEGQQEVANQLSKALNSLLDDGGTLIIEMNPKGGELDLGAVMSGSMQGDFDISALGLTISHK